MKLDGKVLEKISNEYANSIGKRPTLVNRTDVVKEKITLLALVNMIFDCKED